MIDTLKMINTMIDNMINKHPVLLFVIVVVIIVAIIWIKSRIDEKKGINSPEKQRIKEILQTIMMKQEDYDEYIPVYAYRRRQYGRSVQGWYYAIALTKNKLYAVPLTFGDKEIGHSKEIVIPKEYLGKITSGKPGDPLQCLKFFDKDQNLILEVIVEEKNTKFDKTYPVNIMQIEEVRAFMKIIDQWQAEL